MEVTRIDLAQMSKEDIKNLSDFMLGFSIEGMIESYEFITSRSISTHNLYFDAIRKYVKALGIDNNNFFKTVTVHIENSGFGMLGHTKTINVDKYKTNKNRHTSFTTYVPRYISLEEYRKIIEHIESSNSEYKLRNKLIINLMYTRGLRLGEVFGITLEDIKPHPDDSDAGIIILRNRLSDKKYQSAKGCLKVSSKEYYKTKAYLEEGTGYQEITIPHKIMREIKDYIDSSRDMINLSDKKVANICNNSLADNVEGESNKNYYLFLNKNGNIFSSSGWGKILKEIFKSVGIKIDNDVKKHNLSHRFRHGWAMYLIEIEKKDIFYVQKELRHKQLQSTQRYYNPKPEDILKATELVQRKITESMKGVQVE